MSGWAGVTAENQSLVWKVDVGRLDLGRGGPEELVGTVTIAETGWLDIGLAKEAYATRRLCNLYNRANPKLQSALTFLFPSKPCE